MIESTDLTSDDVKDGDQVIYVDFNEIRSTDNIGFKDFENFTYIFHSNYTKCMWNKFKYTCITTKP